MTGPGEPDEPKPRILGDRRVAQRIADEEHVARRNTGQGRPLRELLCLGMVRPPPIDRRSESGQPVTPAESVEKLGPSAAAQEDGHAGTPELDEGRSDVGERSTAFNKGFLLGFEPGGDLMDARMTRSNGVELGTEVVASGREVAASGLVPRQT